MQIALRVSNVHVSLILKNIASMSSGSGHSTQWLRQRQIGRQQPHFQTTTDMILRLKLDKILKGHQSCVNCLEWNRDGHLLASGSDDFNVILWDPVRGTKKNVIKTDHHGNIFSVKFIPDSGDRLVSTCAADGQVKVIDTIYQRNLLDCRECHSSRVKRLVTHSAEPHLLWSAGEDGLIMQYDIREKHICNPWRPQLALIDLKKLDPNLKAKCIAINPIRKEMLAVGCNDLNIRLFDRRRISSRDSDVTNCCTGYFSPGHLNHRAKSCRASHLQSFGATYLTFNSDGSELLVNMNRDQVLLFSVYQQVEQYKSFEATAKKLILQQSPRASSTINDTKQSSVNDWERLRQLNIRRAHMTEEQRQFYQQVNEKLRDRKTIPKQDHDRINLMLSRTKNCPELFHLRASMLISRAWRGDEYQALRDTCCALVLNSADYVSMINLAVASDRLGDSTVQTKVLDLMGPRFGPETTEKARSAMSKLALSKNKCSDLSDGYEGSVIVSPLDENMDGSWTSDEARDDEDPPYMLADLIPASGDSSITRLFDDCENIGTGSVDEFSSAFDYSRRYCGHCNMQTDIKEVNFFGTNQEYVIAGSDDGAFYIWDKDSTNIVKACDADLQILNCLQPHPTDFVLATSGIEHVVKLWSPSGNQCCDVQSIEVRCHQNQAFITSDPWEVMISILYPDAIEFP